MLPTVSGMSRRTQVEMTLEGYRLPKSTSVIYWSVNNLTSEAHFPDPKQFKPERWLRECASTSKPPHSHVRLSFGHGPRMCIGRRSSQHRCSRSQLSFQVCGGGDACAGDHPAQEIPPLVPPLPRLHRYLLREQAGQAAEVALSSKVQRRQPG